MKALSPLDSLFLLIEHRRQPMHVAGLQLFTPPAKAGPEFVRELVEQMRTFQTPSPPYSQRAVFRGRWYWRTDEQFDLDHHLRHLALPQPGRIRELLAMVSRLHGSLMDRGRPLWETNVIEGLHDGRFAMYSKVHHAMFDGVAATREARKSLDEDPDQRDMPPPWARPRSRRDRTDQALSLASNPLDTLLKSLKLNYRMLPGLAHGVKDLLRRSRHDLSDATPYQAPPTMFNVRISSSRRFAAQSYSLSRIRKVGKACGATVNDVALAMCAGALREYLLAHDALPEQPLIAMVPVSVRAADGPEGGNQIAVILANLATQLSDPAQRLATIVASTQRAKERMAQMSGLEQMAYATAALGPMALTSPFGFDRIRPAFNLVVSNVPGPTQPLYLNGARLDESYPVSIPIDGQALNITLTSYCDQIAFGFTACRRSVPGMQRLLDFTARALDELEAACAA